MIYNDMKRKMEASMAKVHKALEKGHGHTILSTGITGDDSRLAKAVVDAGVTMLEPNHPALVLARGYKGITSMHEAEQVRHEIRVEQMAEVTRGVRAVCGKDVYITVGIPGGFTEVVPKIITDEEFELMSTSGADGPENFIMPCLAVAIGSACVVIRLLRSSILGEMGKNYVLTAQAKGLRRGQIILRHVLRNALTPSVTYAANAFGGLLGGSMITESVFSIPGIGSYALTAISKRDYTAIQGYVLFTGFAFVLVCLLADLLCAWLNPKICLGD